MLDSLDGIAFTGAVLLLVLTHIPRILHMMKFWCLSDATLHHYAKGELSDSKLEQSRNHILYCDDCRIRLEFLVEDVILLYFPQTSELEALSRVILGSISMDDCYGATLGPRSRNTDSMVG